MVFFLANKVAPFSKPLKMRGGRTLFVFKLSPRRLLAKFFLANGNYYLTSAADPIWHNTKINGDAVCDFDNYARPPPPPPPNQK